VKTDSGVTEFFHIITGVRQGCILSPFLFLLVIDFVMRNAVDVTKLGMQWTEQTRLTDLDFADDIGLLAETWEGLQELTTNLEAEAKKVGLRISAEKTKTMQISSDQVTSPLIINQQNIEHVHKFTYLGSIFTDDGDVTTDVNCRLGKAAAVFQRIRSIWASSEISTSTKIWLYNAIVLSVATYACDTWKMTAKIVQKLNVFHQRCLRKLLHVTYLDHITNEEVLKRAGSTKLQDIVTERRFRLAGHILRLPTQRHSKIAMQWTPAGGTRKRGRPRKTWRRTFQEDLERQHISWNEAISLASDRSVWRKTAAQCALLHGRN